ncbi:CBS domain-containing protein [Actinophytocola sp.]|uniref:CBS domain-containing protein n=1 Tax=Actinophytocola sp. TaxID=1872138 RepID=UPI0025B9E361|nr:CBS domain-containing protein [Actinophytocola sp.]
MAGCGPASSRDPTESMTEVEMWEPTVESVMTKDVVTAGESTRFKDLVALMTEHRVSGIPIVDHDGMPVGVVSEADTLAKQEYQGGMARMPLVFNRKRRAHWRKSAGRSAFELMTAPAITISEKASVTAAARLLAEKKVRRLCVVNLHGALVGVVSRRDIISTYLREDEQILADIQEHVFRRGMWLFPGTLAAEVSKGVATLEGSVEHRTTAQIAGQLTQKVPGVIGVKNKIRYELDDTVSSAM